jgi:hypothetical protein
MNTSNFFNISELVTNLTHDESVSIGNFIGISDQECWSFWIYLGNGKVGPLFEKGKGVHEKFWNTLLEKSKSLLTSKILIELDSPDICNLLTDFSAPRLEFYIYQLHVFQTYKGNNITVFLDTLKYNLTQIETFDEGDVIAFKRTGYHHHAILTDKSRMFVTHRYGEPENAAAPLTISGSVLGFPTDKALVSEDHLVEIAGYRKMFKSNESYDRMHLPRF